MERKLGINTDCLAGLLDEQQTLALAHSYGFECFTTGTIEYNALKSLCDKADALGVKYPYIHAPFRGINAIWEQGEGYRPLYDGMTEAIDSASACGIEAVVTHVSSGWQAPAVNDLGLSRFDALVEYASEKGVVLAFENLRMVGNLTCLMDRYEKNPTVRFCYDCGHEHCYTKTVKWLDIFTDKLIATHLHDNLSRDFYDKTSDRDTHWLPFDGTFDYHDMMRRLDMYGYKGPLLLEVFRGAREDYKQLTAEEFIATCYDRVRRISMLSGEMGL